MSFGLNKVINMNVLNGKNYLNESFNNGFAEDISAEKKEELIKNTVILKRILVKHNQSFYKKIKMRVMKNQKQSIKFQLLLGLISGLLCSLLYKFWDKDISLLWFGLLAPLIIASISFSGIAIQYLLIQKDFDKLIFSLSKDGNEDDKDFFISFLQRNLFTACAFTREDFDLLFENPYTKEAAFVRNGVMLEVERFFEKYIESINYL